MDRLELLQQFLFDRGADVLAVADVQILRERAPEFEFGNHRFRLVAVAGPDRFDCELLD